ncbi:MAG: 16S rRNA (adenine(1518)-N(6)/adenine(1519)-N(6))-dimethyltransferase RsmA [Actinobacteria bacterium]|nr:16S rRNA (adenine(1518)-N(6)/adenine(1519)-N(6))-dimethyltransferase RsmA [Actinomycetota bacterium]
MLGAGRIRALAAELGLRPTKQWGQNFVIDANTVRRIVRVAGVGSDDVVLEVGPGLGSLTLALLPVVASVTAVEIDPLLAQRLPQTVGELQPETVGRLTVINADAMSLAPEQLTVSPTALVANLPYNVSVPVLLHLLEQFPDIASALVMVQAEVADRLAAPPGNRTYGVPSAKARWYGEVRRVGSVPPSVFWPEPRVDSGLVDFRRGEVRGDDALRRRVFAVIDAAFSQRRKTLRSALAGWAGSPVAAEETLRRAGIEPSERGEQLNIDEFTRIALAAPTDS